MDTVLGVSVAPTTVRMVLVEGQNADGATLDEDDFAVVSVAGPTSFSAPDQVVAAILGTRQSANEAGYDLLSTGVTWSNQSVAAELRDALAAHKVENVMLVSAFLAAAALAQSMGSATGYARAALLYVEPDIATLAVVDTTNGSISDVKRQQLPDDDDRAVATLVSLVSAAEGLDEQPDGLLVVGSGVDIPLIKPALEEATSLPLSVPEQPATALARGAALASANAPLFVSSTTALAYALDSGTGTVSQRAPGYLGVTEAVPDDEPGVEALAYSAVADDSAAVYTQLGRDVHANTGMYPDFGQPEEHEHASRTPFLAALSVLVIFVAGVMALVISLAFSIRPSASSHPSLSHNVVAPAKPAPLPVRAPAAAPLPPLVAARVPVHAAAPAPVRLPGPAPAPLPAPPVAPPPIVLPILPGLLPPLFGPPPPDRGPRGHGDEGWGRGGGGWGHGGGGWGHGGHGRW